MQQAWTIGVIAALNRLWVSLKIRDATDEEATLKAYGNALDGNSMEAINNVVASLCNGTLDGASKEWCPAPPLLATYVRSEQRRLDAINRPKSLPRPVLQRAWIDHRIRQRTETEELYAKGYVLFASDVIQIDWHSGGSRRKWPIGAIYKVLLEEVWAPKGAPFPSAEIEAAGS